MAIPKASPDKIERCKRALERRFGQSVMPLESRMIDAQHVKIIDVESGSWAVFYIGGRKRIVRVAEHDGADL